MRKIYILLTPTIRLAAGAQIYVRNKTIFLRKEGWDVVVYSSSVNKKIMIKELKEYEKYIIRELDFAPYLYNKMKQRKIITNIIGTVCLNKYSEIVIESHTICLSFWGELIAERCNAKHIVFLLSENFGEPSEYVLSFLDFKHKRKELAGISNKSLGLLFDGYKKVNYDESYSLKATCTNAVEEIYDETVGKIEKVDINFGSIGRLDKNYVYPMLDEIICFSKKNYDKQVQLILVGDSKDGYIEKQIYNRIRAVKNLKVIITGRMFPIPEILFNKVDIFIGLAGSARISASFGIPTIVLDAITSKSMGVLGFDTASSLYGNNNECRQLSVVINNVINNYDYYRNVKNQLYPIALGDYMAAYENHLKFITASDKSTDCFHIENKQNTNEERILKFILNTFGFEVLKRITSNRNIIEIRKRLKVIAKLRF